MERRTKIGIAIVVICMLLVGMVIGGVAGGGVGYYLARQQSAPGQASLPVAHPVANV
jgi:hypothetical protein